MAPRDGQKGPSSNKQALVLHSRLSSWSAAGYSGLSSGAPMKDDERQQGGLGRRESGSHESTSILPSCPVSPASRRFCGFISAQARVYFWRLRAASAETTAASRLVVLGRSLSFSALQTAASTEPTLAASGRLSIPFQGVGGGWCGAVVPRRPASERACAAARRSVRPWVCAGFEFANYRRFRARRRGSIDGTQGSMVV